MRTRIAWFSGAFLSSCVLLLATAGAAEHTHQHASIRVAGSGPYIRLDIPVNIYPTAAHADLRDVRIQNANGDLLPHAWLQGEVAAPQVASAVIAIYPIAAGGQDQSGFDADVSLLFKQKADGSLLTIHAKLGKFKVAQSDWIMDVSQIKGRMLQARFEVDDAIEGLFPFDIETSDDLRQWQTMRGDGQIAVLKHGGQKIEKLSVDLAGSSARYLRLHWQDPAQSIALKSVTIDSVKQHDMPAPLQWSANIHAENCAKYYCDYVLPANTPIDSLRIHLSEFNTLASVTLSGQLPANNATQFQRSTSSPICAQTQTGPGSRGDARPDMAGAQRDIPLASS